LKFEGWAFLFLIGCLLLTALSLTILPNGWMIAGSVAAVALGVLSGGLYAAAPQRQK
jgi:hypothetical protein